MKRFPPLSIEEIQARLAVDLSTGICVWVDPTKHHQRLIGTVAGGARVNHHGKYYWVIKLNGIPYKRSQLVLMIKTGIWPDETVDHENGDSLDDRADNLRHASVMQNAWNHKTRKKDSPLPMGVRQLAMSKGFQARIGFNKKLLCLGVYPTPEEAHAVYLTHRQQLFGEFA